MPRRSFFGGGNRDKKSSSKKQLKLSQKYVQDSLRQQQLQQQQQQQQQQRQKQPQQQWENRPSRSVSDASRRSQTSSSQDTPPHQLGPTQTELTSNNIAYSQQYVKDINHQRIPPTSNSFQQSGGNIDAQLHRQGTLQQQQQHQHHQYQVQPNSNVHRQQQQPIPIQQYEERGQQQQYQANPPQHEYVQQYPSQNSDVLPYISQPFPPTHHGDTSQQTAHYQHRQMSHPIPVPQQHYNVVHHANPKSLSVANATDEIWRCATDDFRSASHAIQMLRLAIVAEWESQRMMNEESFPKESKGWSYDPSETFLSLQGAALRFHARFEAMKAEKAGNAQNPLDGDSGERDGIEWELTEQAAWEVWEESVRASAALAHACVGPAWYRQIRMRRQLLRESEMRLIYHSYIQQQRSLFSDSRSETSSIGGASMTSTIASMDMSTSMMSGMGPAPTINPPTDMLQMISNTIPEVLPAAMIRFAASAIETSIPPLRTKETKIFWNPDKKNDSEFLLNSLGEYLCEERRWLRRRRRLGDTQRDLAFALFCASAKREKRGHGNGSESTYSDSAGAKWSIPGCHVPVSAMIHSWLATCQAGWPVPNEFEQGTIPRHTENISSEPSEDHESPIPPKEIVLSVTSQVDSTESNGAISAEFSYWGEIVDLTTIDWWYTLKVLRDCSDLVAAGWRPPPTGQIGEEIVLGLVSIAEQGLEILFEATEDDEQLQKERLAAVSCASETLMALKNLAMRDVLPSDSLYKLVTSLCHFLSAAESTSSDSNEEVAGAMFEKEILAQRQFVAASAAELLWILLSSEDTACTTTDALLDAIDIDLSKTEKLSDEDCARAAGAIRALSAALWGDPPSVKGVPLLRFFWEPVLDILGRVTSTIFHSNDDTIKAPDIAGHASTLITLNEGAFDDKLFVIVLEIVLALRRLVDSEIVYGSGDLCPTEWEAFTKAIDIGLSPWLLYQGEDPLQLEIYDEISSMFFQLQSFLLKCSQIDVGFHQIVDNEARRYLHLFLLRKITPLLQLAEAHKTLSLPSLDGTSIALATIKSWCVMGYLPYREGSWSKRAQDLLQEAFALCENESDSNFIGGHLHSPVVRLEALKSLMYDSDEVTSSRNLDMIDSDSMSASISTVTSASVKSGYISRHSLFSLTKDLRDLHLELIKSILLPRLISILAPEHHAQISPDSILLEPMRVPSPLVNAICCHSVHTLALAEYFDAIEKECILRKFAIRKVGMIFRSRTGEDECRHQLIELLQLTATAPPHKMIEDWAKERGGDDPTNLIEGAAREGHHIQVEAIRQLETCLNAPFCELPHTHGSVPTILKALCDTAISHATEGNNLLTLASILPLARLSCAVNGQGIMMSRRRLTKILPSDILSAISVDDYWSPTCDLNETLPMVSEDHDYDGDKDDVAPLIFVRQTQIEGKKETQVCNDDIGITESKFSTRRRSRQRDIGAREGTTVDFEIVAAVIKSVLQTSSSNCQQQNKSLFDRTISQQSLTELPSVISTICYIALSTFLSHGMAFPSLDDSSWLSIEYSEAGKDSEELLVARSQTIADFAGVLGHNFVYHLGDKKNNREIARNVCYALVNLAKSKYSRVVTNACCGIILLLSSLRHSRKSAKIKMDDTSSSDLISFVEYTISVMREDTDTIILIPLIDAMREVFLCEGSLFCASKSLRRRAYLSCFKLQSNLWSVQAVAFQCAVAIIATMSASEISLMMFVSVAPNHNTTRTNRKRIAPLLFDILRTRLLGMRLLQSCSNSETCSFKPLRVHNKLAREALSLESFPVDDVNGCPNISAWKCGNTILSLKMGSKDSLYRGWLEITMRSPSLRLRRLVRVRKENICQDPDSLLPFWELLHEESAEQDFPPIVAPPTPPITEESEAVLQAMEMPRSQQDSISALLSRFDKVFDVRSSEVNLPKIDHVAKLPSGSQYYSELKLLRNSKMKMLKRTCSDGDLLSTNPLPREEESSDKEDRALSVYSWLQQATNDSVDSTLIKELESFGFSPSALGVPSVIRDGGSSTALFPQVLKPYENKPNFTRSLKILDRLTPFQTHRVALFYGGESGGSDSFLKAKHGSPDFWQFAKELGDFVPIRHLKYFSGGLDTSAGRSDGVYAIVWFGNQGGSDELNYPSHVDSMVIFHTVTLMPNKETNRKRHVGNDVVHIVYGYEPTAISDEAKENEGSSISGHFGFITIYVVPLVHVDMVKISVKLKSGLKENIIRSLDHLVGSWLVSRRVGAHFVRNLAMQADLICQSLLEDKLGLVLNIEDRSGRIHEMDRHLSERA